MKFYYILFFVVFCITGYEPLTIKTFIKTIFSVVYESGDLYTGTYIMFFLFIPFLNVLIKSLNKKQYQTLLMLLFIYFTVFSAFFKHKTFDFIGWMAVMYLIGGYLRRYKCDITEGKKWSMIGTLTTISLMILSIVAVDFIGAKIGFTGYYYLIQDSHKILALLCSVSLFLLFKNLSIK